MPLTRPTRRTSLVVSATALVVLGGGSAVACAGDSSEASDASGQQHATASTASGASASGDREDRGDVAVSPSSALDRITQKVPGEVTELELDHDDGRFVWEADVLSKKNAWHQVTLDADSGKVLHAGIEREDDAEDKAEAKAKAARIAKVLDGDYADAGDAVSAAKKYGTTTELDLEHTKSGKSGAYWEVQTGNDSGTEREVHVGVADGKVHHVATQHSSDNGDDGSNGDDEGDDGDDD